MSREASFGKTKLNNAREDSALSFLLSQGNFQRPDSKVRKMLLDLLGAGAFSARAFDLILTATPLPAITLANASRYVDEVTLVEVKATKAPIADENLHGFFFGATENEYRLAAHLGARYKFAFVVMNVEGGRLPFFVLLTLDQLEARTRTKRVQFQVNLWSRGRP